MSKLDIFYWDQSEVHLCDFFMLQPLVSSDLNFFHGIGADYKSSCCEHILANN